MKLILIVASVLLLTLMPAPQPAQSALTSFSKTATSTPQTTKRRKAQAIAVKGDRIVFVGTNAAAQKYVGQTRVSWISKATPSCLASLTRTNTSPASVSVR